MADRGRLERRRRNTSNTREDVVRASTRHTDDASADRTRSE
jgi:hypothetical protein